MDQEYEALIVKNIVSLKHFPLIGVNAADTGFYLGPFFIYFAAIPFFLFSGNPLGWAVTASTIGVVTTLLLFKVGEQLFTKRIGLVASLFYGGSFLSVFYDRKFWNPTFVPLFSLLLGFFIYQILKGKSKPVLYLAILLGLSFSVHLSLLIFIPLIFLSLYSSKKIFKKKILIYACILFLIFFLPFVFFDLRHDFLNTKATLNLIFGRNEKLSYKSTVNERGQLFLSSLARFFWTPIYPDLSVESGQCQDLAFLKNDPYPEEFLFVLALLLIFFWYFNKATRSFKKRTIEFPYDLKAIKLIVWIILLSLIFIVIYQRALFEYYFLYLFPWLALIFAISVDLIWRKKYGKQLAISTVVVFLVLNMATFLSTQVSYSYQEKEQAISFAKRHIVDGNYSLEAVGHCPRFGGYRYLFEYFIKPPSSSYMDSYFAWLYEDAISQKLPERVVLLSLIDSRATKESIAAWQEEKLYFLSKYDIEAREKFGQIKIFILKR